MDKETQVSAATLRLIPGLEPINGIAQIGSLSCPDLAIDDMRILLDTETVSLVLVAPCGCRAIVQLASHIKNLAQVIGDSHANQVTH